MENILFILELNKIAEIILLYYSATNGRCNELVNLH